MKRFRFTLNILAAVIFTLTLTSLAQAQATRTWVSGVGDDVNPCSRTAPCKTFAGAISKTAAAGEISVLDPGGFGTINITKSITIDGGGIGGSILSSLTTGVIVNAGANDRVYIRNITINGAGNGTFGMRYLAGGELHVDHVSIIGFTNHGITVAMTGAVTGRLFVSNSYIRTGNTSTSRGINIQPASGSPTVFAVIDNTHLERMFIGLYVGAGGRATISNSVISQNNYAGVVTEESGAGNAETMIDTCKITYNGIGIQSGAGATTTRISNNNITNNFNQGLFVAAGFVISLGNNTLTDNGIDGAPTSTIGQL
ncbi:MAG: right-handed parallel beta-helix repeat-containing protein [Pyrinomonadaceae bacterium]|nr:right-handed parallel beta-helix repeat-containing protein [Pyrinomonadaceae bacterium]